MTLHAYGPVAQSVERSFEEREVGVSITPRATTHASIVGCTPTLHPLSDITDKLAWLVHSIRTWHELCYCIDHAKSIVLCSTA